MANKIKKNSRVTINDIARYSGYSKTAVSFAFNDPSRISEKTRKIIIEVSEKLGYIPDPVARNFSLRRQNNIGILLPHLIAQAVSNPYIVQIIQGIGSVCERWGYTLTLIPPRNESVIEAVRSAAVDGLIILGMESEMSTVDVIRQREIPNVTIDGKPSSIMPGVNIDDRKAAYDIMKLVLNNGHRYIGLISLSEGVAELIVQDSITWFRMAGYRDALKEFGLYDKDFIM